MVASVEICTKRVIGRRKLRFASVEEAILEGKRIAAAEHTGGVRCLGNWTVGQIFNHVGAWSEYSFVGTPKPVKVPVIVKWMCKPLLRRFLKNGLPASARIPGVEGGTFAKEPAELGGGLARFIAGFERLKREMPTEPHALWGEMTHEEWIGLNLRHAELHFSFIDC